MNDPILRRFLLSFGVTLLAEGSLAILLHLPKRSFSVLLLVNLLTNPLVVYLDLLLGMCFPTAFPLLWQLPLELGVILTEGWIYSRMTPLSHPWRFSLAANLLSYGLGLLLPLITQY